MLLTKAQILAGVKYTETLTIEELGGDVTIRALSDGELSAIEAEYVREIGSAGIKFNDLQEMRTNQKEDFDLAKSGDLALAAKQRDWAICAKALSVNEEWKREDVEKLPRAAVEKIVDRAEEISGAKRNVGLKLESFRQEPGESTDQSVV
jgi:hypothetical protein